MLVKRGNGCWLVYAARVIKNGGQLEARWMNDKYLRIHLSWVHRECNAWIMTLHPFTRFLEWLIIAACAAEINEVSCLRVSSSRKICKCLLMASLCFNTPHSLLTYCNSQVFNGDWIGPERFTNTKPTSSFLPALRLYPLLTNITKKTKKTTTKKKKKQAT